MRSTDDWSFRRFMRESRAFTRPMSWWKFYPAAVRKWFWFDRQQRRDNADRAARSGVGAVASPGAR